MWTKHGASTIPAVTVLGISAHLDLWVTDSRQGSRSNLVPFLNWRAEAMLGGLCYFHMERIIQVLFLWCWLSSTFCLQSEGFASAIQYLSAVWFCLYDAGLRTGKILLLTGSKRWKFHQRQHSWHIACEGFLLQQTDFGSMQQHHYSWHHLFKC